MGPLASLSARPFFRCQRPSRSPGNTNFVVPASSLRPHEFEIETSGLNKGGVTVRNANQMYIKFKSSMICCSNMYIYIYIHCVCTIMCVCTSSVTNNILAVLQGKIQWSRLGTRYMYFLNGKHLVFLAGDRRQQGGLSSFSFKNVEKQTNVYSFLASILPFGTPTWGKHVEIRPSCWWGTIQW